jgi:hypothetical protein
MHILREGIKVRIRRERKRSILTSTVGIKEFGQNLQVANNFNNNSSYFD